MKKKNKTMRVAGTLFVATMLTTSMTAGTFAKYTTGDSASDSARVAKFGVVVEASGSLFEDTYIKSVNTPGTKTQGETLSVVSSTDSSSSKGINGKDKVVAPGTKNTEGITLAVSGTPEVNTSITVAVSNVQDVYLKKIENPNAAYANLTTSNVNDCFNPTADYYPIKYTLTQTKGSTTTILVNDGNLSAVKTALEALTITKDANVDLADEIGTLKLTWEWDFDASGAGTYDKEDTLLGDLAANSQILAYTEDMNQENLGWLQIPAVNPALYNLTAGIQIDVTVTQVD